MTILNDRLSVFNSENLRSGYLIEIYELGHHWLRLWLVAWEHQAITSINPDSWSIKPQGTCFYGVLFKIRRVSLMETHLKMFAKWQTFCSCLNVLSKNFPLFTIVHDCCAVPLRTPDVIGYVIWWPLLGLLSWYHTILVKLLGMKSTGTQNFNTLRPRQNGCHFYKRHFQMHFLKRKCLNCD